MSGVLVSALRLAGGGGVLRRLTDGHPASSLRRRQQESTPLSLSALRARNVLVLEHLNLADAIASAAARHLFPLVERKDLIQVAREALVRSAFSDHTFYYQHFTPLADHLPTKQSLRFGYRSSFALATIPYSGL